MKNNNIVNSQKVILWNTKKKAGWTTYKNKTEHNEKFMFIANVEDEDPNKLLSVLEKELTSVKHASFGKVKISKKDKDKKRLENLQREKSQKKPKRELEEINSDIESTLKNIQRKEYDKELKELDEIECSKGKSAAIYKLKDKI